MSDSLLQFNFLLNIRHAVLAYCFVIKVLKNHHSLGLVGPGFTPGEVSPGSCALCKGCWWVCPVLCTPKWVFLGDLAGHERGAAARWCWLCCGFGHRGRGLLALGCVRPSPTASVQWEETFNGI